MNIKMPSIPFPTNPIYRAMLIAGVSLVGAVCTYKGVKMFFAAKPNGLTNDGEDK